MLDNVRALEIAKAKSLRGDIITTLYGVYPNSVSASTLRSMLRYKGIMSEAEIKKALDYLKGKKYIAIKEDEEYWNSGLWLLPCGINLAELDFEDVGVCINE